MAKFEVGTVVKLKSGGPKMTVVHTKDSAVTVKWSDSGVIHSDTIPDGAIAEVDTEALGIKQDGWKKGTGVSLFVLSGGKEVEIRGKLYRDDASFGDGRTLRIVEYKNCKSFLCEILTRLGKDSSGWYGMDVYPDGSVIVTMHPK